jgi:hypothetical protein
VSPRAQAPSPRSVLAAALQPSRNAAADAFYRAHANQTRPPLSNVRAYCSSDDPYISRYGYELLFMWAGKRRLCASNPFAK